MTHEQVSNVLAIYEKRFCSYGEMENINKNSEVLNSKQNFQNLYSIDLAQESDGEYATNLFQISVQTSSRTDFHTECFNGDNEVFLAGDHPLYVELNLSPRKIPGLNLEIDGWQPAKPHKNKKGFSMRNSVEPVRILRSSSTRASKTYSNF